MNLSEYTFEQLVKLRDKIADHLISFKDGFVYICNVRSYDRHWVQRPSNAYSVSELCYQYNGED